MAVVAAKVASEARPSSYVPLGNVSLQHNGHPVRTRLIVQGFRDGVAVHIPGLQDKGTIDQRM